ncbi:MAG: 2OG-Fe(II) oxygenase family protein [Chloroflexota bacterium]
MSNQSQTAVPIVNITGLQNGASVERDAIDQQLGEAAKKIGAAVLTGLPETAVMTLERAAQLNAFFAIARDEKMAIALNRTDPTSNRYWRGYMNKLKDGWILNEMYDIGRQPAAIGAADFVGYEMVAEETPFPASLPSSWLAAVEAYDQAMYGVSLMIVKSLARYLGKDEDYAAARFANHNSTLRLLNYPLPPADKDYAASKVDMHAHDGKVRAEIGGAHTDAAALSFLWQTPGGGLQAQDREGEWLDVPRVERACSVHMGEALGIMTAGVMPATPHRVLSTGAARQAIGFFLEPAIHASVLPWPNAEDAEVAGDPDYRYGPWILNRYGYV